MKTTKIVIATFLAVTALMSGCANTDTRPISSSSSSSSYSRADYGVIDAIEITRGSSSSDGIAGSGIGAGTVIGGVVGGLLGNQVGGGTGKDVATVAGVVGGAMVGHEIEKRNKQQGTYQDVYRIRVRLDNGGYQTLTQQTINDMRVGDRVRIENNQVSRY